MNYCLSSQVDKEYYRKAQEIRIKYKELNKLLDIYELNPNLSIILRITSQQKDEIKWDEIDKYNKMWQNKIIIETDSFDIMDAAKLFNIRYFYAIPVNNFYDLKALADYGCCDVKIDAPLTHMLDKLDRFDITIRMSPNIAYYAFIPRKNGIIGGWVRPEDTEVYEEYIDVFEFEDCDKKKEEALYRIYAEQKSWPSDLNGLISNLNYHTSGKLILPDFAKVRMFCGQKCTSGFNCNACQRILDLANNEKIRNFMKNKDKVGQ